MIGLVLLSQAVFKIYIVVTYGIVMVREKKLLYKVYTSPEVPKHQRPKYDLHALSRKKNTWMEMKARIYSF